MAVTCAILVGVIVPAHSDEEQNREQERSRTHRDAEPEAARRAPPGTAPAAHNGTRFSNAQGPQRPTSVPATISLGESIDAVSSVMGSPARIVDPGAKQIYVYPELKITFQDGKVSDVQ